MSCLALETDAVFKTTCFDLINDCDFKQRQNILIDPEMEKEVEYYLINILLQVLTSLNYVVCCFLV